jgi:hypothetical protein
LEHVTQQDRFYGWVDFSGIDRVVIEATSTNDWAMDHLQYGAAESAPEAPGRVATLLVARSATAGDLTLSWSASCSPAATNYAIYEGAIGSFTSHALRDCGDDGGDLTEEVHPASGDAYYLVVPYSAAAEGSYGTDSLGAERPPALGPRCVTPQVPGGCP